MNRLIEMVKAVCESVFIDSVQSRLLAEFSTADELLDFRPEHR